MIVYGYAKGHKYSGDGTLMIQARVPNVHGPYSKAAYQGKTIRNYTEDKDLPWYPSLLLPYLPTDGDVVAISSLDDSPSNWMVIGLTGGSYRLGATNI